MAQASPAGPAPTMTTSISIASALGASGRMQAVYGQGWLVTNRKNAGQRTPREKKGGSAGNITSDPPSMGNLQVLPSHALTSRYLPTMQTPPAIPGFRAVPFTGVIYVMAEAARRGLPVRSSRLVQPRPGQPETGLLPGGATARGTGARSTWTIRSTRRSRAFPSCARRSRQLYNSLYRRGMKSQYTGEERLHLRRRASFADPRGVRARPR